MGLESQARDDIGMSAGDLEVKDRARSLEVLDGGDGDGAVAREQVLADLQLAGADPTVAIGRPKPMHRGRLHGLVRAVEVQPEDGWVEVRDGPQDEAAGPRLNPARSDAGHARHPVNR